MASGQQEMMALLTFLAPPSLHPHYKVGGGMPYICRLKCKSISHNVNPLFSCGPFTVTDPFHSCGDFRVIDLFTLWVFLQLSHLYRYW